MTHSSFDRRSFLKAAGLTGAGLWLGFASDATGSGSLVNLALAQAPAQPAVLTFELHPFIVIDNAGGITLINHRPDMGQASWQAVPMMIAEELEVRLDQVQIRQSDGLRKYGDQLSGGSSTVRTGWKRLREAGAAARQMFITAAAARWKAEESDCYAENGAIHHRPTRQTLAYGALVDDASKLPVPATLTLKAKRHFKVLGKSLPRPEVPGKVTGKAVFGMDLEVPGMLYASIEHSPVIHGKIVALDDTAARRVPGVKAVIRTERPMPHRTAEAVAVLATNYWAALQGRRALRITWDHAGYDKQMTTDRYFAELRARADDAPLPYYSEGNFVQAYAAAPRKLQATYETPFLAHAPLEPEVAVAHVKADGSCELWAPVQGPDGAIAEVAKHLGIAPERVTVHVPFLGGAFGRKAYLDFVLEAVNLSKAVKAPVKVIWTREDDITQGPYRPGMLSAMKGAVNEQGEVLAFAHTLIGESIKGQVFRDLKENEADDWAGEGIGRLESPYAFSNALVGWQHVKTDIPVVWWRSVYASNSNFGHESFMDELAHAAGKDPLTFRLALLKAQTEGEAGRVARRFVAVLETLAQKAGWQEPLAAGEGRGLAICRSFGTICAHAVSVSKQGAGVRINRITTVLDCGMYVNPDNVRAQTEGNIVMGLTAATKSGITFAAGQAEQQNFHNYQLLRLPEMPPVAIHLMENEEEPGGVGEPGLPPLAPALCNAVFAATGKRIRTLPFDLRAV